MAFLLFQNDGIISGSQTMFLLKERLKSMSWSIEASSNGVDASSSVGDVLENFSDFNNSSWFRARAPNGKEFVAKNGTAADKRDWLVYYSGQGSFTTGTLDLTNFPSASDGVLIVGTANGSVESDFWFPTNTPQDQLMIIGGEEEDYSWAVFSVSGTGQVRNALYMDNLSGTSVEDDDNTVFGSKDYQTSANIFRTNGTFWNSITRNLRTAGARGAWWRKNLPFGRFVAMDAFVPGHDFSNFDHITWGLSTSSFDGRIETLPMYWGRGTSRINCKFIKGESRIMRLNGSGAFGAGNQGPQTVFDQIELPNGLNRIIYGTVNVPYDTKFSQDVLNDSPYLYWRMDELAASRSWDHSGNENHGIFSGNISYGQNPITQYGQSIIFNTTGSGENFAYLTGASGFPVTDLTVEVWISGSEPQFTGSDNILVRYQSGSSFTDIVGLTILASANHIRFDVFGESTTFTSSTNLTSSVQHLVATWQSSDGQSALWLNGEELAGKAMSIGSELSQAGDFVVGNDLFNSGAAATISVDDVLIFSGVLTGSRILSHFSSGLGL